jgi:hypothetical protein
MSTIANTPPGWIVILLYRPSPDLNIEYHTGNLYQNYNQAVEYILDNIEDPDLEQIITAYMPLFSPFPRDLSITVHKSFKVNPTLRKKAWDHKINWFP